jgi:hypothetical protein
MFDPLPIGTMTFNRDYEHQSETVLKAMFVRNNDQFRDWLFENFGQHYAERIRIRHIEWGPTWFTAEYTFQPHTEQERVLLTLSASAISHL